MSTTLRQAVQMLLEDERIVGLRVIDSAEHMCGAVKVGDVLAVSGGYNIDYEQDKFIVIDESDVLAIAREL